MTTWKYVEKWVEGDRKVKDWVFAKFTTPQYRAEYAYHLKRACEALNVKPTDFLVFLNGEPSELFGRTKRYLETQSSTYHRKAHLEKAAIQSFVRFYNDRPTKFTLDVDMKNLAQKWARPRWGSVELQKMLENIHRKYRPLIKLGAYCGFGRKELVYFNQHYAEVKPVSGVPEAVYLDGMPARKSKGRKRWAAILPREEFEEYKKHAPVRTFVGRGKARGENVEGKDGSVEDGNSKRLVDENDLTQNIKNATERAEIRVIGTNSHVLRSIFKTIGLSQPPGPNVDEDILDVNMGHTDVQNYDRRSQDIEGRARAMLPLWEYMRHGAPVASSNEVKKLEDQLRQQTQTIALMNIAIQQLQQAGKKTA